MGATVVGSGVGPKKGLPVGATVGCVGDWVGEREGTPEGESGGMQHRPRGAEGHVFKG